MAAPALLACGVAAVREEVRLALEGLGAAVEETETAAGALARLDGDDPPGVVVLDPAIPGGDRPDLPRRFRDTSPETVVLVLADPDATAVDPLTASTGAFRFLVRPWTPEDLRGTLRVALARHALLAENRRLAALHEEQQRVLWEERERLARLAGEETTRTAAITAVQLPPGAALLDALQEAFDGNLALHARAVSGGARDLARALDLPDETVTRIEAAGLLHDVGHLGLPRFLLVRPADRLTDREREELRRHPVLGAAVLAAEPGLEDVARLVRHHHERFDGTGYPDGLRGEGIPLGARVVRLVDVHDRAYRTAASAGAAVARTRARRALREASGEALDPALVDLFLKGAAIRTDSREIQVRIEDLRAGMVLTRDLRASTGLFLAAEGTRLDTPHVERIQTFHLKSPIAAEVFVRT